MKTLTRLKETLPTKVADDLRKRIMICDLKEGEHLAEASLSEEYGVSRGPIRDALQILISEGFAKNLGNGRTIVTSFTADDIKTYYEMRLYIEKESINRIFEVYDADACNAWVSSLEKIHQQSMMYVTSPIDGMYNELDIKFHYEIVSNAGRKLYTQIWMQLSNYSRSIMDLNREYLFENNMMPSFDDQSHMLIIKALKDRNKEEALRNLSIHFKNGVELYMKILTSVSEMLNARSKKLQEDNTFLE